MVTVSLRPAWIGMGWAALAFVISSTSAASRLDGQDSTVSAVSATFLRVLAEAADVHRTGRPVFLVADYRYPHNVIGHLSSRAAADKLRAGSGTTFGVFGPYVTAADPIPDTASRVTAVRVTRQAPGGRPETINLDLRKVDALFLSMSAIDKFVVPYYSRIYGPAYAEGLRRRIDGVRPICHARSFSCFPRPDGTLEFITPPEFIPPMDTAGTLR